MSTWRPFLLIALALILGSTTAAAPLAEGLPPPAPGTAPPPAAAAPAPDDPYLWLEEVQGERALAWVRDRNAASAAVLDAAPGFAELERRLLGILDSKERIPMINKRGRWYYNLWKDAQNPRGLWRRTTLAQYRQPNPQWETVLDLDALGAAEGESWVFQGALCLRPAQRLCLLLLSRGGADANVVREFDLQTKRFVRGGFSLPEAKNRVGWIDANTLFVGTDFGPGSLTDSGYPRVVKRWRRGTPLTAATPAYEVLATDIGVNAWHDPTRGFTRDLLRRAITFYTNEVYLLRGGKWVKVAKPDSAEARVFREWLFLELRDDWSVAGKTWPAGALLAIRLEEFLAGGRGFDLLFTPAARTSLVAFSPTRHHVLINVLDNVRSRIEVLTPGTGGWTRQPVPGAPELATVSVEPVDPDEADEYFLTISGYTTPTSLLLGTAGGAALQQLKQLPALFDATGLEVSQHEAVSADGTRIPYFQVARRGLALDGKNPTLLYGYGGFEVSLLPKYTATVGAAWLEQGGVYVVANLRGGGEFGPRWHKAALKANRPRAYEDFSAVAEDLVRRQVTSPQQLGAQGGSNGGLLMGNMLTRRPELFGAIVCMAPLLDMRRYHTLLAGASWMGEYGNPDDPTEWAFLEGISPYHQVKPGVRLPPALFTTSTRDDRVHPGHARKMMAKLLADEQPVLFYENIEGGHGGAADNKQAAHVAALAYTFLWQRLAPAPASL
ncbi:MAG: prolyl oligopeptidase family serine peptidase [Myxococcota bacterium]|jgi:prolyl oligopeptidase|nr:prolyl oligopeptidase family serine peptidase [Myxococcota bacterium]